jgi:hypothetical protein
VRRDSAQVLRAMQRTGERQKTLAVNGVLWSDAQLSTTLDVRSPMRLYLIGESLDK